MNVVTLMGRLVRDPETRYTAGDNPTAVAKFTLAVDRRKKAGENEADFISCVAFGKQAEWIDKYMRQGKKIGVVGEIRTGSYINKDGAKVYTTDVCVTSVDFADGKDDQRQVPDPRKVPESQRQENVGNGFMNIPDGVEDESLPFN